MGAKPMTLQMPVGCSNHILEPSCMYGPAHHELPLAQWLEDPTGAWKVMGSIPLGGLRIFSDYLTFILHRLKGKQTDAIYITKLSGLII